MQELHEKASAGNGPRIDKAPTLAAATSALARKLRREIAIAACFVIRSTICRSNSVCRRDSSEIRSPPGLVRLAKSQLSATARTPAKLTAPDVVGATITGPSINAKKVATETATIAYRTLAGALIARAAELPAVLPTRTAARSRAGLVVAARAEAIDAVIRSNGQRL